MSLILESGSALFLASVLIKGAVLLSCAALVVRLLRGASAAARHLVWTVAVIGVLVLPLGAQLLESSRIALTVPFVAVNTEQSVTETSTAPTAQYAAPSESAPVPSVLDDHAATAREYTTLESTDAPPRLPVRNWKAVVLTVWLSGVMVVLATLLGSTLRVMRLKRRSRRVQAGPLVSLIEQLAARLGIRRVPRLHMGDAHHMPMVWGLFRPVLLLPDGAASWTQSRLQAVILHELAHVRRRDAVTQLLAELARALYWCNPLVWLAARQLYLERELACDDIVLSAGTRPSEYAGELLDLVRTLRTTRATSLAAIAMARPSQLKARLHAVLDEARSHRTFSRAFAMATALLALLLVLPLAALQPRAHASATADLPILPIARSTSRIQKTPDPAVASRAQQAARNEYRAELPDLSMSLPAADNQFAATPDLLAISLPTVSARLHAAASSAITQQDNCGVVRKHSISHNSDDGIETMRWSRGRCSGSARIEGTVRFTDDFDGILSLSAGGLFRLEEDDGEAERRVEVRSARGELEYRYRLNGRDAEFDAAGRAWLRRALLTLVRTTGFAAEQRVAQLLRTHGADGVLAEVQLIASDHVQSVYLRRMLERTDLAPAQVKAAVDLAGRELESDYELAQVLIALAGKHQFSDETRRAFIAATSSIESDYEQRRVLGTALARGGLNTQDVTAMLAAAENIGSDYERATLLMGLAERYRLDPAMRTAYLKAAQGIGSDYEQRRVLTSLLARESLSPANLNLALQSAAQIESDYDLAQVLQLILEKHTLSAEQKELFMKALNTIGSEYEYGRVATRLLRSGR